MNEISQIHSDFIDTIRRFFPECRLEVGLPKRISVHTQQDGILYPIHAPEINKNFDLLICL